MTNKLLIPRPVQHNTTGIPRLAITPSCLPPIVRQVHFPRRIVVIKLSRNIRNDKKGDEPSKYGKPRTDEKCGLVALGWCRSVRVEYGRENLCANGGTGL